MVYYNEQKFTDVQKGIIGILFRDQGQSISQKNLANQLTVSETAIKKALQNLITNQYVVYKKVDNRTSIAINDENEYIMGLKRYWNLTNIYASGFEKYIKHKFPGSTIIIFGSYARGDDTITSDIDVAIIGSSQKKVDLIQFETDFQKSINIHFFEEFKQIHKNLKENLCNGFVLSGAIEL